MSLTSQQRNCIANDLGFTLIEVMISLFILAIGLLGMAALQNQALKFSHAASIDSQAQYLMTDIAERIRANRGNDLYVIDFIENAPAALVDCGMTSCTSDEMAAWDLTQWRAKVQDPGYMPNGESQILFDSFERTFVISIRYDWSQLGGVLDIANGKRTVTMTTRI